MTSPWPHVTGDIPRTPLRDPFTPPPSPHPPTTINTPPPHQRTPSPTLTHTAATLENGYATLPLPTLCDTDIRLISHNINTLPTTTNIELETTFVDYKAYDPTVIGLQECNRNWNNYIQTEQPLRTVLQHRWPASKLVTAQNKEDRFTGPHQPGGVAQIVLRKLTG